MLDKEKYARIGGWYRRSERDGKEHRTKHLALLYLGPTEEYVLQVHPLLIAGTQPTGELFSQLSHTYETFEDAAQELNAYGFNRVLTWKVTQLIDNYKLGIDWTEYTRVHRAENPGPNQKSEEPLVHKVFFRISENERNLLLQHKEEGERSSNLTARRLLLATLESLETTALSHGEQN